MRVQKRGNRGYEEVKFDKIVARIRNLCDDLTDDVDPVLIAQSVIKNICDGITTEELDRISARAAESYKLKHPSYGILAARILVSNLHKGTPATFSDAMELISDKTGIISEWALKFTRDNAYALDAAIDHERDYSYDYLGFITLEASYLRKIDVFVFDRDGRHVYIDSRGTPVPFANIVIKRGVPKFGREVVRKQTRSVIIDRPQYMLMRVAMATCLGDLARTLEAYDLLSSGLATHATPTMFNACSPVQQLNSCFIFGPRDDTRDIMDKVRDSSLISKSAGGIGIWMHDVRCSGSLISTTGGRSSGIPKQIPIFDDCAVCWNQGGKRKGSFAMYLEPWHADIFEFLDLKNQTRGDAKNLFYGMWVPDLFVKRAEARDDWSLFGNVKTPGLSDVYDGMDVCTKCKYCPNTAYNQYVEPACDNHESCAHDFAPVDAFTTLYERYEEQELAVDVVPAWDILDKICESQRDNGTPYICFKDHVNRTTNQKNIGTIKSSNLCTEIMEWSSPDSYACCTLASISLPKFVDLSGETPKFDFAELARVAGFLTESLDNVIDVNTYPVKECEVNSVNLRPIGIGVQGLANAIAMMGYTYLSPEAADLDAAIFETIYYASADASARLAVSRGSYVGFEGSPASRGILSPDMWVENQARLGNVVGPLRVSGMYDWGALRDRTRLGMRNSLLVAPMPTQSTSAILGNTESFEPFGNLIETRGGAVGKTVMSNNIMIRHLLKLGLWSAKTKLDIINNGGSVQSLDYIPADVREMYKTVYELPQMELMKRAAARLAYIDQSQSLNIHLTVNSDARLRAVFFNGWRMGAKTGSYYIRTRSEVSAMRNNIAETSEAEPEIAGDVCYIGKDGCIDCSS